MDEQEGPPRITDKRGQNKGKAEPVEPLTPEAKEALAEALAEQAKAAEQEEQEQPAYQCAACMLVTIDSVGAMRMFHTARDMSEVMSRGVNTDREATPADISNMSAQLNLTVMGNEVSSRVMQVLAMQAQAGIAARTGPNGLVAPGR